MRFQMFENLSESARTIVRRAQDLALNLKSKRTGTEHLLLALVSDDEGVARPALAAMGLSYDNVRREVEKIIAREKVEAAGKVIGSPEIQPRLDVASEKPEFDPGFKQAMRLAGEYSLYFGHCAVESEHLLFGLTSLDEGSASAIIEELGGNQTFLRRQVMKLMAGRHDSRDSVRTVRPCLTAGIKSLVYAFLEASSSLERLGLRCRDRIDRLPRKDKVVPLVLIGYLSDFLIVQVPFQRYLLQENLRRLQAQSGPLTQEEKATIVANGAQFLRQEVRYTIEHLWSDEFQLADQVLDEGEHDLIGSDIEDLWWAHSEELALDELFEEALDDHRRKHVLSLQQKRNEIASRISKSNRQIAETVRQCFVKRSLSA